MVWARLDDQMLDNPKIAKAGVYGFAMHVAGIIWCCRNLSDGHIPYARVTSLLTLDRVLIDTSNPLALVDGPSSMGGDDGLDPYVVADHLVTCAMWIRTADGYEIHDFLDYNPSRAEVEAKRAVNRSKQQKSRDKRKNGTKSPGQSPSVSRGQSPVMSPPSARLPDPDPDPDPISSPSLDLISSSEPVSSKTSTGTAELASEMRLCTVTSKATNAAADGAFGSAVAAWAEGIRSVTGKMFLAPPGGSDELARLVQAIVQCCPDMGGRVEWARDNAAAFARDAIKRKTLLNVYRFIDWLNTPAQAPQEGPADPTDPYHSPEARKARQDAEQRRQDAEWRKREAEAVPPGMAPVAALLAVLGPKKAQGGNP